MSVHQPRPGLRFDRLIIKECDGAALVFMVGPVVNGVRDPIRWVGAIPLHDRAKLKDRCRTIANEFAISVVEDRAGCLDPQRGPWVYRLGKRSAA